MPALQDALEAGLDLVSGMHARLAMHPPLAAAAARAGRRLLDLRRADLPLAVGTGRQRSGGRLLTVGTDCALGKKYAALALAAELQRRGVPAEFRATGQTGIMISGRGIAVDAVVAHRGRDRIRDAHGLRQPPPAQVEPRALGNERSHEDPREI